MKNTSKLPSLFILAGLVIVAFFILKIGFNVPPTDTTANVIDSVTLTKNQPSTATKTNQLTLVTDVSTTTKTDTKVTVQSIDTTKTIITDLSLPANTAKVVVDSPKVIIPKVMAQTEISVDADPPLFKKTEAGQIYLKNNHGHLPIIHDAWNYPEPTTIFQKNNTKILTKSLTTTKTVTLNKSLTSYNYGDVDPSSINGSVLNCRTSTSIHGYFKAYFEDVALGNGLGYNDATHGQVRQDEVCHVLVDMAHILKLDTVNTSTDVAPDIIFAKDPGNLPANALAAASAYYGFEIVGPDNGSLHYHIINRQDPTPNSGSFDGIIYTKFGGVANWDVDSILNAGTYSFYTVMTHEIMHSLGFHGLLPAIISTTNVAIQHDSFDENTYQKNPTNILNRFFKKGNNSIFYNLLQIPVGSPSSWFTSTNTVYQGTKNIIGATPDGARPVFSPFSWQQGSSLSHFYNSTTAPLVSQYIMNPSIAAGTSRNIQNDEKEVLCHLGYQVDGITGTNASGCGMPTPIANNDFKSTTVSGGGGIPGTTCIDIFANDVSLSGGTLSLDSLQTVSAQAGDVFNYFTGIGCTGTSSVVSNTSTKSIQLIPTTNTNSRILYYTVSDSAPDSRISFPATIVFFTSVCSSNPNEYVCNGDFEQPFNPTFAQNLYTFPGWSLFWCQYNLSTIFSTNNLINVCPVPFWTGDQIGTPDVFSASFANSPYNSGFQYWSLPALGLNSPNGGNSISRSVKEAGGAYLPGGQFGPYDEPMITKLKNPLIPGQAYIISFDAIAKYNPGYQDVVDSNIISPQGCIDLDTTWSGSTYSPTTSASYYNFCQNLPYPSNNQWTHVSYTFTPTVAYEFLRGFGYFQEVDQNIESSLTVMFDNFSIKKVVPATNSISGIVYYDLNGNHIKDNGEQGISGIHVGLFSSSSMTMPIQIAITQNDPNPSLVGKYTFTNVGNTNTFFPFDYIALMPETGYQSITQPISPSSVNYGVYTHAYRFQLSTSGQNITNKDFGVVLNSTPPPGCFFVNGLNGVIACL